MLRNQELAGGSSALSKHQKQCQKGKDLVKRIQADFREGDSEAVRLVERFFDQPIRRIPMKMLLPLSHVFSLRYCLYFPRESQRQKQVLLAWLDGKIDLFRHFLYTDVVVQNHDVDFSLDPTIVPPWRLPMCVFPPCKQCNP